MQEAYFITGTDTGVGKTWTTVALMRYFKNQGKTVVGMKPIASGCTDVQGQLRNDDALLLQENCSEPLPYQEINPYAMSLPVAPHIAAEKAGVQIDFDVITNQFQALKKRFDVVLVEGVGGWYVPVNGQQTIADFALVLDLPVILVVAMRLGCINHALLSFQAIQKSGVTNVGWIANCTDPDMLCLQENISTIKSRLDIPLLGVLPYSEDADFDCFAERIKF